MTEHAPPLSRRQLLRLSGSVLLASGLWPGSFFANDGQGGAFKFVVVNDLHLLNEKCTPWFEKAFHSMKSHPGGIDFVLVAGDLVEQGKPEQFALIRDALKTLAVPFHVVVGNHDYQAAADRKAYEERFPKQINYHFDHHGWQFLGIDTSEGTKSRLVQAQQPTLDWLDATLPKLDPKKPTVLFTHFPLGFGTPFILMNANAILDRFKAINLQAAFSGHYHGFTDVKIQNVPLTTNKCCSFFRQNHDRSPEKGYFLCQAKDGKVSREFVRVG